MHDKKMPMDYHIRGAMMEHYSLKLTNIAELKDCFVDDME